MEKQHKYCTKMPLSLDSVEIEIDTLIDILQQLKQDKDYSDIRIFNIDKLEFFGDVSLTDEEYKEILLEEIENELKQKELKKEEWK